MAESSEAAFHLSPRQRRLWRLQQGGPPFLARCTVLLEGEVDRARVWKALADLQSRHEILRTTFRRPPGSKTPFQIVHEPELQALDGSEPGVAPELSTDLESLPVLRASLAVDGEQRSLLHLVLPALCVDFASLCNLVGEIATLYDGKERELEEPVQYVDFADWQNEQLEGLTASHRSSPASIPLPFAHEATAGAGFTPRTLPLEPWRGAAVLRDTARKLGVSARDLLLAAWLVLLGRLLDRTEVSLGELVPGRLQADLRGAVGLFAGWRSLGLEVRPERDFAALSGEVRTASERAGEEPDCGEGESAAALPPFPEAGFEYMGWPEPVAGRKVRFSLLDADVCCERFALAIAAAERGEELAIGLRFDSQRVHEEDARRLGRQYAALLSDLLREPVAPVAEASLLTAADRRQILAEAGGGWGEAEAGPCVHELFAAAARRAPERVALVCEETLLTYGEVAARSSRLAHRLRRSGVGPEATVALLLERSVDLVVALLGVLKAGGAYVPLDPGQPRERLAALIGESGARVVLAHEALSRELPPGPARVLLVDAGDLPAAELPEGPETGAENRNLAYVIFTSGSTGRPKGVVVEHRNLAAYTKGVTERLGLAHCASFATVSTFAADLGHTAIFPALCSGATLHIVTQERAADPSALEDYCERHRIDCLKIVPSHLEALLSTGFSKGPLPRRCLILGGEALRLSLARRLAASAGCAVHNHYGPTETTVGAASRPVTDAGWDDRQTTVPIGRSLPHARVYVLDERLQPVPPWCPGQIYIGGAGVARGYHGQPGATADRFLPDPLAGMPGMRMYRTGDRARITSGGEVEFLGRADRQVKIRGFRVEPGEIEAALSRHPAVREAVVVVRGEEPGRLVAYAVSRSNTVSPEELLGFLGQRLPSHMIPSRVVLLEAMPLNRNGKVDRGALPDPAAAKPVLPYGSSPPAGPVEEALCEIWAGVLGCGRVGRDDNFFQLGGDSILAIQVVARARQAGLLLAPMQVFQHQTVAELATMAKPIELTGSEPGSVAGPVPLTPIQRWFFELGLTRRDHWNQAVLLELGERVDPRALAGALGALLIHHDALRLRFVREAEGWWQQGVEPDGDIPFTVLDVSALPESALEPALEAAQAGLQGSFDLERGPLLRSLLARPRPDVPDRLLLVAHHLVVDGVSWRVLLEDLQTAYRSIARRVAPELPAKTSSFRSWAKRLGEVARSHELRQELGYWQDPRRRQIAPLPVDHAGGQGVEADSRSVSIALDAEETRALLQEVSAGYRAWADEVLLTALVQAFNGWTGQRALLVDLEGHGRGLENLGLDLTRTVGWFTSVCPVLLEIPAGASPGESVRAVKEQVRAVPRRGIGYGLLRYLSGDPEVEKGLRDMPRAQVAFNYLGQFDQIFAGPSLFRITDRSAGPVRGSRNARTHLLSVNGWIARGRLQVSWGYDCTAHRRETIELLASEFLRALRALIAREGGFALESASPTDFPLAGLDERGFLEVSELLDSLDQVGKDLP